ncbi:transposase family protein [Rothia amarae]|uniref:helix-turn-helix domain-containing protein n=1 Tax=Rothia amarae TaxID=169480 RepID=UPI0031D90BD7
MHNKRTTGLTQEQFTTHTTVLKITLLYLRHNLTEELLAEAYEVSQPTISRSIHRVEDALLDLGELKIPGLEFLKNTPGSLVVDGTLIPVWN